MVDRAAKLSSTKSVFIEECGKLKRIFCKLKYPKRHVAAIINASLNDYLRRDQLRTNRNCYSQKSENQIDRVQLPYKDQTSANAVRNQLL